MGAKPSKIRSKKTSVTVQDHRGAMFKKYDINQNIMGYVRWMFRDSYRLNSNKFQRWFLSIS